MAERKSTSVRLSEVEQKNLDRIARANQLDTTGEAVRWMIREEVSRMERSRETRRRAAEKRAKESS